MTIYYISVVSLNLTGPLVPLKTRGFLPLLCTSTDSDVNILNAITLTINGQGHTFIKTPNGDTAATFTEPAIPAGLNMQWAQCHYRDVSSNPYHIIIADAPLPSKYLNNLNNNNENVETWCLDIVSLPVS